MSVTPVLNPPQLSRARAAPRQTTPSRATPAPLPLHDLPRPPHDRPLSILAPSHQPTTVQEEKRGTHSLSSQLAPALPTRAELRLTPTAMLPPRYLPTHDHDPHRASAITTASEFETTHTAPLTYDVHDPSPYHPDNNDQDYHALVPMTHPTNPVDRTQRELTTAVLKTAVTANLRKWTTTPFSGQPQHLRTYLMDMTSALSSIEDTNALYQVFRSTTNGRAQMIVDSISPTATSLRDFVDAIYTQCASPVYAFNREHALNSLLLVNDDIESYIASFREILLDLHAARNTPTPTAVIRAFALGLPRNVMEEVLSRAGGSSHFGMEDAYACARQYFIGRALRAHSRYEPPARPDRPRAQRHTTTTTSTATRQPTAPTPSHQTQTPPAPSTTTTSSSTSTSLPATAPPSTASTSRPRFPAKLTDSEREQLRAANGCFTCRVVHEGGWKTCPFPRPQRPPAQPAEDARRPD